MPLLGTPAFLFWGQVGPCVAGGAEGQATGIKDQTALRVGTCGHLLWDLLRL